MTKKEPAHRIRIGRIVAAVWPNESKNGTHYSVTFERLYKKDGDEQWSYSDSFGRDDLLVLAKLADLAHTWVTDPGRDEK